MPGSGFNWVSVCVYMCQYARACVCLCVCLCVYFTLCPGKVAVSFSEGTGCNWIWLQNVLALKFTLINVS